MVLLQVRGSPVRAWRCPCRPPSTSQSTPALQRAAAAMRAWRMGLTLWGSPRTLRSVYYSVPHTRTPVSICHSWQLIFKIPDYTISNCNIDARSVTLFPSTKYKLIISELTNEQAIVSINFGSQIGNLAVPSTEFGIRMAKLLLHSPN